MTMEASAEWFYIASPIESAFVAAGTRQQVEQYIAILNDGLDCDDFDKYRGWELDEGRKSWHQHTGEWIDLAEELAAIAAPWAE